MSSRLSAWCLAQGKGSINSQNGDANCSCQKALPKGHLSEPLMGSPDKGRLLEAKTILMPEGNSLPETAKSLGQQWLHHEPENFRVLTEKAEEMAQRLGPHYPCPLPHPQHLTQVPDSPGSFRAAQQAGSCSQVRQTQPRVDFHSLNRWCGSQVGLPEAAVRGGPVAFEENRDTPPPTQKTSTH